MIGRRPFALLVAAALCAGVPAAAFAAVDPLPRADILARGQGALGFSYYWGHGSWSPGLSSSAAGTCSGNCPSCTHAGRYGADCSGFVCKAWSLPSTNSDVTADSHPYSTADLITAKAGYWTTVAEADVKPGDARVYRSGSSGHTYLIREVTGAGRYTTLEAKGCSYGILSTARSDGWVTQRRAQVVEPAPTAPATPEVPSGPAATSVGAAASFCTRSAAAQGGSVTDSFLVRSVDKTLLQTIEAPAAASGAEMCVQIAFTSAGTFKVSARAFNAAGTSAESAAVTVVVAGSADGGVPDGGADAGPHDGGSDAGPADAGPAADAGSPDAGRSDGGPIDAGNDTGDEGDGPALTSKSGCGGCGSADIGALALLGLCVLRRRRKALG